jgi:hypothetical protein
MSPQLFGKPVLRHNQGGINPMTVLRHNQGQGDNF